MSNSSPESVSPSELELAVDQLNALSVSEYGVDLDHLAKDPSVNQEDRIIRIGRLMGVALKKPFSTPTDIDPRTSTTRASHAWNLEPDTLYDTAKQQTWQFKAMEGLGKENGFASVEQFALDAHGERGFFSYLSLSFHRWVCGDPELKKKIDEAVEEAKKHSGGATVSPHAMIGAIGAAVGTLLLQAIPWLTVAGAPLIAGFVVLIATIGLDAYCGWSGQRKQTGDEERR